MCLTLHVLVFIASQFKLSFYSIYFAVVLSADAFLPFIEQSQRVRAGTILTNVQHVKAEWADRWTPRLFGCPPLIKSCSCSWPCVAKRPLLGSWQFVHQEWAAIHHSWQVKACAQSVYIHNYKASTCPWAARGQEHLLGHSGRRTDVAGEVCGLHIRWEWIYCDGCSRCVCVWVATQATVRIYRWTEREQYRVLLRLHISQKVSDK